jgi:hypothetical protein
MYVKKERNSYISCDHIPIPTVELFPYYSPTYMCGTGDIRQMEEVLDSRCTWTNIPNKLCE